MNRVQLAIFPAILISIVFILVATNLISSPHDVLAAQADNNSQPAANPPGQSGIGGGEPDVYSPAAGQPTQVPNVEPIFVDVPTLSEKTASTSNGGCTLNNTYPASVLQWCGLIEKYARKNGLEPGLVAALITQESGGDANAYSGSGAVGLMQVMPRDGIAASFMCNSGPCFTERPSSQQLTEPEYNIAYGTKMLAELVKKYGTVREALKNYGPIDVGYYYADLVLGIFNNHP